MKHVTITLDEETLAAGQNYAQRHNTTLDEVVTELLRKTVVTDRKAMAAEMIRLMNLHQGKSTGERWTRDELYER
jgi:hypothetical protein